MFTNQISNGWIKLYKKIFDNPIVTKDPETFMIWVYLLTLASHKECQMLFTGNRISVPEGSFITTLSEISEKLKISKSKVNRALILLESETQIKRTSSNQKSLIIIVNWSTYQTNVGTQSEAPVKRNRNADETQPKHEWNAYINKNNKKQEDTEEIKEINNFINSTLYSSSSLFTREEEGEKSGKNPSEDEVARYAEAIGSSTDPHEFWSYCNLNQWTCGGKPIKDWRALFRQWKPKEPSGSFDVREAFLSRIESEFGKEFAEPFRAGRFNF